MTQPAGTGGVNLDKFFKDVESVKEELKELDRINETLRSCNEQIKTLNNAKAVKDLRSNMDGDFGVALKKAKMIKVKLEALYRFVLLIRISLVVDLDLPLFSFVFYGVNLDLSHEIFD